MKEITLIKNFNASWGVQNRVEAFIDWRRDSITPFEIDVNGESVLIIQDDAKKEDYAGNNFKWESDKEVYKNLLDDIKSPMFQSDGVEVITIKDDASPEAAKKFTQLAVESCGMLGLDLLRLSGLDVPKIEVAPMETQDPTERAKKLEEMSKHVDLNDTDSTVGLESLNPEGTTDYYNSETDELNPVMSGTTDTAIISEPKNDTELDDTPIVSTVNTPVVAEPTPIEPTPVVDSKFADFEQMILDNGFDSIEAFIKTVKTIKALVMKKADTSVTADNMEEPAAIDDTPVSEDNNDTNPEVTDVTGEEDYNYTNGILYPQNPNEGEAPVTTQSSNVEQSKPNSEIGTESIDPTVEPTTDAEPQIMTPETIYDNLVNDDPFIPEVFNYDAASMELADKEFETMAMESIIANLTKKKPSKNQVEEDIKTVFETTKKVAEKAWEEIQEVNADVIAKYGAFIKLIFDIKEFLENVDLDAIGGDKPKAEMIIATANVTKADKEVVPDSLTETIANKLSNGVISYLLGPAASAVKKEDAPGKLLLGILGKLATKIKSYLYKNMPKKLNNDLGAKIVVTEGSEIGCYDLKLILTKAPKLMATAESVEMGVDEDPLAQIALESVSDNDMFERVMANKDKLGSKLVMECVRNNMFAFYKTGQKVPNDEVIKGQRILAYVKK